MCEYKNISSSTWQKFSKEKTPTQGILKCTIWNAGESSTEVPEYLNL